MDLYEIDVWEENLELLFMIVRRKTSIRQNKLNKCSCQKVQIRRSDTLLDSATVNCRITEIVAEFASHSKDRVSKYINASHHLIAGHY